MNDDELEEMLNEGKGPINFTVFLSLFGEKLNGKSFWKIYKGQNVLVAGIFNTFYSLGTDPEDTILAAFKLFDPNGTGFVNKDE